MTTLNQSQMSLSEAQKILASFSCTEIKTISSPTEKEELQKALLLITDVSDAQNFGICADSIPQAMSSLMSYLNGLNYEVEIDESQINPVKGPVYLKFNAQKWSIYTDSYEGKYRGVLVSCQSAYTDELNVTYGHFPLDLFEN